MAHQSLYRTYRPQRFSEVAGQEEVVGILQEQLKQGTVGHAYLFAGSRGLGKTSIARIFAKELGVTDKDLYEIDAASTNGVDDIRDLSENIHTLPFESPKKLYILDEAHMLSKGAWNAFLKTLEEPPSYALFILATTELDKVPETVQSRCQVFEFKKPSREGLAKLVEKIAKKEGYTLDGGVSELVALLADGSYRDSLSILEKLFSVAADKKVSREEAEKATGAPKNALVLSLLTALSERNAEAALVAIRKAADSGVDMRLFLALVLDGLRAVLLVRYAPELKKEIEGDWGEEFTVISGLAGASSSGISHTTLRAFLDAAARVRYSPVPALPLELAAIETTSE